MNAFEYLKSLPRSMLPRDVEKGIKPVSNGALKRWLTMSAVIINGVAPKPYDEITFPIKELIFFPKGKRRTTIVKEGN